MPPPAATPSAGFRLLPPEVRASLSRATRRLWGLGLIALAAVLASALRSYDPADPSLNTAGPGAVDNALGWPGAVLADLMLQTVGLAAAVPVVVLGAWGLRLLAGRSIGWLWLRGVAIVALVLLAAMALAAVGRPLSWPLVSSLGGFAGPLLVEAAQGLAAEAGVMSNLRWLFSLLAAVGMLALTPWCLAFRLRDVRDTARGLRRLPAALLTLWRGAASPEDNAPEADDSALPLLRRPSMKPPTVSPEAAAAAGPVAPPAPAPNVASRPDTSLVNVPPPKAPPRRDPHPLQGSLLPEPVAAQTGFVLPPLTLLAPPAVAGVQIDRESLAQNARLLEGVLSDFGVNGQIVQVRPGPVVTLYELEPAPGTKTSRVVGLADDIARSMSALAVRIAVVPGKSTIGIELPNARRQMVNFRELLAADAMAPGAGGEPGLILALGRDIGGEPMTVDLSRMPHLLIAGTTGSGKSVAVNTMICSLLYRLSPEEVRFIMIDPKMLELSVYDGIPHLLSPVVTDPGKAVVALKWAVKEMENRYRAMSQFGVRNIAGYNTRLREATAKGQQLTRTVQVGFDPETGQPTFEEQALDMTPLPFVVVIVDEMADLMLVAGKDVEAAIQRLAQMARAAGIHLIMATQRPSVDVITGTIKANFPTRISFQVTSKIDSRTILGEQGAEQLLGQGDMLYMAPGGRITRVHGPFITDTEVEQVVAHLRAQGAPDYVDAVTDESEQGSSTMLDAMTGGTAGSGSGSAAEGEDQALFDQAVALVARERKASTSSVQRYLQIGYNRAARLIERMEAEGMISKPNRVGKREVLLPPTGED